MNLSLLSLNMWIFKFNIFFKSLTKKKLNHFYHNKKTYFWFKHHNIIVTKTDANPRVK
jgi:hypothetical protein